MVVSSPSTTTTTTNIRSQSNPKRPPLLPSSENVAAIVARRPKSRNISSRYLSTTSSSSSTSASSSSNSSYFSPSSRRRCPSPLPVTPAPSTPATVKRSQSVERRRGDAEMSAAAKLLMSSSRSLSASFQGGSCGGGVNTPRNAVKSASPGGSVRRGTPERKMSSRMTPKIGGENARVIEQQQKQQPWPGRSRPPVSLMSRSIDLGGKNLMNGSSVKVVRALKESLQESSDSIVSDMDRESVSSECNSGSQDESSSSYASKDGGGRGIVVPSKYWQEVTNSRSKRAPEPGGSPVGRSNLLKGTAPSKLVAPKRLVMDSPVSSPRGAASNRGFSSPLNGSLRPSSPNQMPASPAKLGSSVRPASPARVGSSLRPASPAKVGSSLRPPSPTKVGSSTIRPASPAKVGSSTVRSALQPQVGSSTARSASPAKVGSSTLRPASPAKVGSSTIRPASPARVASSTIRPVSQSKEGSYLRPSTPSTVGASLRSASPSRAGASLRPGSPSRVGATLRVASTSRVGAALRPATPSKVVTSVRPASPRASRESEKVFSSGGAGRMGSPSRARNAISGTCVNTVTNMPSVLYFGADLRRVGDSRLEDAHLLRILHNRHLQWRFVNARAQASMSIQKLNSERSLYNAWRATIDLRERVCSKRKELQWLKQNFKVMSILKRQMLYLEEWALMVKDHCSSLSGAIESIKASTLRLPLVSGAKADIRDLKDAICAAADVMHSMASSICSLLEKVEKANSLVAEVASITLKEQSFLNECKDILSMLYAMQVQDCSLRAHVLQLKCAPSVLAIEL